MSVSSYIQNLWALPKLYRLLQRNKKVQEAFMQKTILQDLEHIKKENDGSLSNTDFQKIKYYYGNAVASILGESFCMLRGEAMSVEERSTLTYLGAVTGLFDDFFDEKNTPLSHVRAMIDTPDEVVPSNTHEKLFLICWKKVIQHAEHIALIKKQAYDVFDAQIQSRKQKGHQLSPAAIREITFDKGASSILFYRAVFGEIKTDAERNMLSALGSIGQLENDIFDVYKDAQAGVATLVTTTKKISEIRRIYNDLHECIYQSAWQTSYAPQHITSFLRLVSAIISRGYVCLHFLEKCERRSNNVFTPSAYERKQLVCDMEQHKNIMRSLHYYAKMHSSKK